MTSFTNTVALITGAGSGIGVETARQLAARGARVVLLDRDLRAVEALAQSFGNSQRHLAVQADVTDSDELESAVQQAVSALGGIDVVVANAGVAEAGTVAVSRIESLVRTVDVNLTGVIRTVHATLPHVTERRGYFLLVSSAAALKNVPGGSSYAASKAGVEAFAGALRLEVAHKGVAVGVAHPAWIRTPMYDAQCELASVSAGIASLPWPFNVVTTVEECAGAFVDGIAARDRKIYVPRALSVVDKARSLFTGALWDRVVLLRAAHTVPALEQEIRQREFTS